MYFGFGYSSFPYFGLESFVAMKFSGLSFFRILSISAMGILGF